MPHKLARAIETIGRGTGAEIYGSTSVVTDDTMQITGMSRTYRRPFEFGNALVQNVLTGNTMVAPPVITDHLRTALAVIDPAAIPFHDWWIYQMVTGAGFDVVHDQKPGLFYRQHTSNVMGAQQGHAARRAKNVLRRNFAGWIDANIANLHGVAPLLTKANRKLLYDVLDWRTDRPSAKRRTPNAIGLYRQSLAGDLALQAFARLGLI